MKLALAVTLLAVVAVSFSNAASLRRTRRQLVPAEFRNINIENYLKNPRSVLFQLKCIVYDGPCDRIGKYLKVTIPELITGTCGHCSPSDRQTAGRLVAHIQKNFPKEWHDAIKKYQGGQAVKPEDAQKFESLLGVKIETEFVSSTPAPAPAPVPVEASSTVAPVPTVAAVVPPVAEQPAPVSSVAPAVETKPVEVAAPVSPAPAQETAPLSPAPAQVAAPVLASPSAPVVVANNNPAVVQLTGPPASPQPSAEVPVAEGALPADDTVRPTGATV